MAHRPTVPVPSRPDRGKLSLRLGWCTQVPKTKPKSHGRKRGRYLTVWVPDEQGKGQHGKPEDEMRLVRRLTTGEDVSSDTEVVDVEPLRYHCYTGIIVPGGKIYG